MMTSALFLVLILSGAPSALPPINADGSLVICAGGATLWGADGSCNGAIDEAGVLSVHRGVSTRKLDVPAGRPWARALPDRLNGRQSACQSNTECRIVLFGCGGELAVGADRFDAIETALHAEHGDPRAISCESVSARWPRSGTGEAVCAQGFCGRVWIGVSGGPPSRP